MAILGTLNQSRKIVGPARVYIALRPVGGYTGADDAARYKSLLGLFFSDAATGACKVLIPSDYADINAEGVEVKLKQNSMKFDPNLGAEYKISNSTSSASVAFAYKDIDANKIIDAFSCLSADVVTTTAATGVAGRKTVMVGRQTASLEVAILIRYPSMYAGEYEHIIVPYATLEPEFELKVTKDKPAIAKLTASAIGDMSLIGTQPMPPIVLVDSVSSAAS